MSAPSRTRAFRGAASAARKPRKGPNNLCDDRRCGHFRSDHRPNSGPCKIEGCECEGMKW
ncbi:hypothetical protein KAMIYU_94 [Mycobacterium phage Kamiyu]|uniref:Uncharacterized protein n=4 Tax=Pipefishvirus TaxID=1982899 RepID=A0A514TY62_9CAUD|nr:hypothetical protein PHAEDRUS_89 [Mycobacterium phage Phaedrus]YP_002564192.1 gp94 [Mycobacterium phage Phlyer]YP_009011323.1 hypothetical protein CM02_gp092 [Mycobacterium phage Gadjet]YP_009604482.1 hypothetical protein FDH90_gp096 [Mycobacterium phage Athena]YP_010103885.1 hypothetical protein KNU70_gp096 [Mycobacterium phage Obutu]AEJ94763.1 hypothetical protein DAISY_93 [Mycobacterium phage Daisy]AER50225.1 hypothetical protein KAMIYU_94 [Mycobacterium phage Kamiyu]AHN84310.1 hypothe